MTLHNAHDEAYEWVKNNQSTIIKHFTGNYADSGSGRVSVFMAGAPGAGKTEFSKTLVNDKFGSNAALIVRIDPDEIRTFIPMYQPGKAELLNHAVTKAVEILIDHCFDKKFDKSFLLDGTLSNYEVGRKNIDRALRRNRKVFINFVYKDPVIAWGFTQAREALEGRNIPKENFIDQYFGSIDTMNKLKEMYGDKIQIDLVQLSVPNPQNHVLTDYRFDFNITSVDGYIKVKYSKEQLRQLL